MKKGENIAAAPIPAEVNTKLITAALMTFDAPAIDLKDPEAVRERIEDYFNACDRLELRPGNMGLYASLGLSRQEIHNDLTGRTEKLSPESRDTLKKALQALAAYREQLGAQGKINPVTLLFWQKNFDGFRETLSIETAEKPAGFSPTITAEEARAALANMDYTDEEGSY